MKKTAEKFFRTEVIKQILWFFIIVSMPLIQNNSKGTEINDLEKKNSETNILSTNKSEIFVTEEYLEKKGKIDYILGVGDLLAISFTQNPIQNEEGLILPKLTNFENYLIEGDGTVFLPRFNNLYVEGLTVSEFKNLLEKKYQKVFLKPVINIKVVRYRPIQIFIDGEIENPGLYSFLGRGSNEFYNLQPQSDLVKFRSDSILKPKASISTGGDEVSGRFPDLYSVIKKSGGITAYSDLTNIQVIRRNSLSKGGGKIKAEINFLDVIRLSDNSNNIRILDGDRIFIKRSPIELTKQLSQAVRTSLNPKYIDIVVTGRVENPGQLTVSKTSTLNDVIKLAGGAKILKGSVEFTRFKDDGEIELRKFNYSPRAIRGGRKNPYMKSGDIVTIGKGAVIATKDVINEVTSPFIGIYSTYAVLDSILN